MFTSEIKFLYHFIFICLYSCLQVPKQVIYCLFLNFSLLLRTFLKYQQKNQKNQQRNLVCVLIPFNNIIYLNVTHSQYYGGCFQKKKNEKHLIEHKSFIIFTFNTHCYLQDVVQFKQFIGAIVVPSITRTVTKISSYVNIEQLGSSFGSVFLLSSMNINSQQLRKSLGLQHLETSLHECLKFGSAMSGHEMVHVRDHPSTISFSGKIVFLIKCS